MKKYILFVRIIILIWITRTQVLFIGLQQKLTDKRLERINKLSEKLDRLVEKYERTLR